MKNLILIILLCWTTSNLQAQQKSGDSTCPYIKTLSGYKMVLRESDDVITAIENLVKVEKIPSGHFTGIGFADKAEFGFYDSKTKKFNPKTFEKVEMGSLTGSIAWNKADPSIHIHGVATDVQFNAYGGHILSLVVGTGSMEIYITVDQEKLERKVEYPLEANVLQLPCKP